MSFNDSEIMGNQTNHTDITAGNQTNNQSTTGITLKELNDTAAIIYYGADILFGVLMLPGIIGNLHVLHIYIYKKPNNNTRVYVIFLAILDLISCTLVFPFNIVNCLLPYMYYDNISCKIFMYLNSFATLGSAFALLVIAVERYRKICTPFKTQITIWYAKLSCIFVTLATMILSAPLLILFGSTRIPTYQPGYYGYECHYVVELRNSYFQLIYSGGIVVVTTVMSVIMVVLYTLIGFHLWRQNKKMERNRRKNNAGKQVTKATEVSRENNIEESQTDTMVTTLTSDDLHIGTPELSSGVPMPSSSEINGKKDDNKTAEAINPPKHDAITENQDVNGSKKESSNQKTGQMTPSNVEHGMTNPEREHKTDPSVQPGMANQKAADKSSQGQSQVKQKASKKLDKSDQMRRTSYMFFLITLCFLISYIPHPILRVYQLLNMEWYMSLELPGLISFHTALVALYINNAVNSFIYTICDSHYRQEIKTFYIRLLCCWRN